VDLKLPVSLVIRPARSECMRTEAHPIANYIEASVVILETAGELSEYLKAPRPIRLLNLGDEKVNE